MQSEFYATGLTLSYTVFLVHVKKAQSWIYVKRGQFLTQDNSAFI